jgi:hypothetical protein
MIDILLSTVKEGDLPNIKELARATKFRAFAAILAEEEPHLRACGGFGCGVEGANGGKADDYPLVTYDGFIPHLANSNNWSMTLGRHA